VGNTLLLRSSRRTEGGGKDLQRTVVDAGDKGVKGGLLGATSTDEGGRSSYAFAENSIVWGGEDAARAKAEREVLDFKFLAASLPNLGAAA